MKKLSISLLVMLLIASLFTSCSMGSDDASDVRVKVKITPSGGGRSLTTDIETINLDDDSITWHYSATKVTEKQFNYGATSDSLLPKDGIVTLSQGDWTIGLRGEKDGKNVFAGTIDKTIKWNFYEPNVTVPVPVNENTGDKGYIVLTDVKIKVGESEITPNYASIDGIEITNLNGAYMKIECAPGTHSVTFAYKEGTSLFGKETISVEVKSGLETKVIGFIDGSGSSGSSESQTTVMQPIEVKKEAEVKIESSIVPLTTSSPETKTTVTFEAGSFTKDSTDAVLNLSVKSVGSEFSVTSTGSSTPVAGINISLLVNGNEVKEFNGKEVVIETYIAKDLTDVKVQYIAENTTEDFDISNSNNDPGASATIPDGYKGIYYKDTGKLIFKTPHFSEYYVLADEVQAYNTNQNKVYATLQEAIDAATSGDTIVVLKDIVLNEKIKIEKSIIIKGQGFGISCGTGVDRVINIQNNTNDIRLIINDLDIVGPTNGENTRGLSAYNNTGELYIELNNCEVSASYYALNIASENKKVKLVANNCVAIGGWCAAQTHSSNTEFVFNNCELIGLNDKNEDPVGWNDFGTVVVNTSAENSSFTFNNSIIKAIETEGNIQTAFDIRGNNTSIVMNSSTIELEGNNAYSYVDKGENNTVLKDGNSVNLHLAETFNLNADNVIIADDHTSATGSLVINYLEKDYPFNLELCPNDDYTWNEYQRTTYICRAKGASSLLSVEFDVSTEYGETNSWCGVSSCEFIM